MALASDTLNTKYLHFDAFSMKDAIKKFLTDDPNNKFTDHMYEGSNLSVIIDLVALMYQCLIYNLNNTASESMFSDTQLYGNINRIVKLIGYNPRGYTTSIVEAVVENANTDQNLNTLPKYAFVDTGKKDSFANPIYYSTIDNITIDYQSKSSVILYNGIWRLYNVINVAKETPYETFILNISSNPDRGHYIAYPHIDVYVKNGDTMTLWRRVDNIYDYYSKAPEEVYELRLTESGEYSIKCGDGIYGKKFPKNSQIYVMYLQSNGQNGVISSKDINNKPFVLNSGALGLSMEIFEDIYDTILKDTTDNNTIKSLNLFKATNNNGSSVAKIEETVNEIKENAPDSLNIANRLVTASDIQTWLKLKYSEEILDTIVMNNWQYITKFYGWLYNLGMSVHKNPQKYINSSILSKHDLNYTDAADCNSIYCWIKTSATAKIQQHKIKQDMENSKILTSNIELIPSLNYKFAICAAPEDYTKKYYLTTPQFDETDENYIEITIDDALSYSPALIKNQVKNTIISFFADTNFKLGSSVDLGKLMDSILSIEGITNIRTCFIPRAEEALKYSVVAKPGLYFASWTDDIIDKGDDLYITTANRKLEDFQFPSLVSTLLDNKIKVITTNNNIAKAY